MFPLYDERRTKKIPFITILLIAINTLLFFYFLPDLDEVISTYGFRVIDFSWQNLFISMFIHAGIWHLLGNMWFLWIFGDNLEGKIGHFRFLLFYLLCGVFSMLIYTFFTTDVTTPVVGASGAISGVLGGYLIYFPRNKIKAVVPLLFFWTIVSIPAVVYVILWFIYQLVSMGVDQSVAYIGHIGGFLTGLVLVRIIKK